MKKKEIINEIIDLYDNNARLIVENESLKRQVQNYKERKTEKSTLTDKFKDYTIKSLTEQILSDGEYWYDCNLHAYRDENTDNIEIKETCKDWINNLYKKFDCPSMFSIDELKPYLNISLSEKYTELSNKEVERFLKGRKENKGVEND